MEQGTGKGQPCRGQAGSGPQSRASVAKRSAAGLRAHSWVLMEQPQPQHKAPAERGGGWGLGGL